MYLPLIRRAVQMDTARGPAGVSLGLATAWIAASVALCSLSVGALCITSFVFASILRPLTLPAIEVERAAL